MEFLLISFPMPPKMKNNIKTENESKNERPKKKTDRRIYAILTALLILHLSFIIPVGNATSKPRIESKDIKNPN